MYNTKAMPYIKKVLIVNQDFEVVWLMELSNYIDCSVKFDFLVIIIR